jgi:crossover junction endodeoxyribonuclease RuvC
VKVYLGVDPGLAGGFAAITADAAILDVTKMPHDPAGLVNYLLWLRRQAGDDIRAVLEFVRSSPQQGVASAFTFGRGYGRLETALHACQITFDEVHPLRWQRLLDCRSGGDKSITKRRALELFPDWTITNFNADALLLAEYRRRLGEGIAFHEVEPTPASRLRSFVHTRGQ